jgi:tetratricopeptide (TPR) repeat protein
MPTRFFTEAELLYRLTTGLQKRNQEAVALVGSALSAPISPKSPGVQGVAGVVHLIRSEFEGDPSVLREFDLAVDRAGSGRYQEAFLFLQGRLGQSAANEVVRRAVLEARARVAEGQEPTDPHTASEDELRALEFDSHWFLNPGMESLGKLIVQYPVQFGRYLLTTNFDPLVEVAVRAAGGSYIRTALHSDGNLKQTEGTGCHIIHLHGYWYGSDTLHTPTQLQNARPNLKASLTSILRNKLVLVCGYGGWDDIFTEALFDIASDDSAKCEVLWTFYDPAPIVRESLLNKLSSGITRGRVSLHAGIDCNEFLPRLYEAWKKMPSAPAMVLPRPKPLRVNVELVLRSEQPRTRGATLDESEEDRPPLVEFCVGRDSELRQIEESSAKVIFLTGIGGEGKSTLAAEYFSKSRSSKAYDHFVWRDCKEESERFEIQLALVIESLSGGAVSARDISKQDIGSIARLLVNMTLNKTVLFVFDNADHYVNLEANKMTSGCEALIEAILESNSKSRVIFTCRPNVEYEYQSVLSCRLEGLSLEATRELFLARKANSPLTDIEDARSFTNGHAFWLDLLSIQVAKQSSLSLAVLLNQLRSEQGSLPEKTLNSIWNTLSEREKLVLRSMAETVRPESLSEIADYLAHIVKYHKVAKTMTALRSTNLVVVKPRPGASDLFELHPLVRQFIRQHFSRPERKTFIDQIVAVYNRFLINHKSQLNERPTITTLQYWTQTAELDIAAGRTADAIRVLQEVGSVFSESAYSREFSRVMRLLLNSFDWVSGHDKYKLFDAIFAIHIKTLSHLGEWDEVRQLLDKYELTVLDKDARYILYCGMKCYDLWLQGDFSSAVKWGRRGKQLKESSNVDTEYDVRHNLALAERDAGKPEDALSIFLEGRNLNEVIDPDELDEERNGAHYGNIGRCLHFMGQVDSALICYQKSALLIEKDPKHEHIVNQGYVRRWIGELLLAQKQNRLAAIFLEAARLKWEKVSPPMEQTVRQLQAHLGMDLPSVRGMSEYTIERTCLDWISGRLADA